MVNRRFCGKKSGDKNHQNEPEIEKRRGDSDYLWKRVEQERQRDVKKANSIFCSTLFEKGQTLTKNRHSKEQE